MLLVFSQCIVKYDKKIVSKPTEIQLGDWILYYMYCK